MDGIIAVKELSALLRGTFWWFLLFELSSFVRVPSIIYADL